MTTNYTEAIRLTTIVIDFWLGRGYLFAAEPITDAEPVVPLKRAITAGDAMLGSGLARGWVHASILRGATYEERHEMPEGFTGDDCGEDRAAFSEEMREAEEGAAAATTEEQERRDIRCKIRMRAAVRRVAGESGGASHV